MAFFARRRGDDLSGRRVRADGAHGKSPEALRHAGDRHADGGLRAGRPGRRVCRAAQEEPGADQAAGGLQDQPLCRSAGCASHRRRAAGRRHLRRHAQGRGLGDHRPQQGRRRRRGEALRPLARLRHSERAVLLQGRLPLYRRAQPHPGVPGGGVFLREPGHRGGPGGETGRPGAEGGGELQPHGAGLPHRPGQEALCAAGPALQRAAQGERWNCTKRSASAASCA